MPNGVRTRHSRCLCLIESKKERVFRISPRENNLTVKERVYGHTKMNALLRETPVPTSGLCDRSTRLVRARRPAVFATSAFFFLWLFVFSVPWEGIILVPGFGTAARVIGFVAFGLGAVGILERGYIRPPGPGLLLLVLFVTWSSVTYFWSINQQASMVRISTYSQLLVAAFLISQFCSSPLRLKWMIQAYILGSCVSSVDTIVNYYMQRGSPDERYSATGLNANDVGLIIALSLPFSYQMAVETRGGRSWFYRLHLIVAITAILLTASRSAMVASLVALSIVPITGLLRRSRRAFVATLVTGAIASCAAWLVRASSFLATAGHNN